MEEERKQWLKKMEYMKVVREYQPFFNATQRTVEFNFPDIFKINDALIDLAYLNNNNGIIDKELLNEVIEEIAYGQLTSFAKTFNIKYTQKNDNGTKILIESKKIIR